MPVRTIYDPAAGTGGMLMVTMDRIKELNPKAIVKVYGQELNDETWAIAQSDLMMQDIAPERMRNGNTLTADAFSTRSRKSSTDEPSMAPASVEGTPRTSASGMAMDTCGATFDGTTTCSSCITIDAVMNGMIPSANSAI